MQFSAEGAVNIAKPHHPTACCALRKFPDVSHGSVAGQPIQTRLQGDTWLEDGFITTVQQRGAAILKARGLSSALSAASSGRNVCGSWARLPRHCCS
eukprot:scaffold72269_cov23-Tisochrysis_lutea.AAC.2